MKAWLAVVLLAASGQEDSAALIGKLRSADAAEAERAQGALLKMGAGAVEPLRKAAAASADAAFRKRAGAIADRLETRKAMAEQVARGSDRWYRVHFGGTKVGWIRLKTEAKDGRVTLTDEVVIHLSPETKIAVKAESICANDEYLSPQRFKVESSSAEQAGTTTGEVKDGKLTLKTPEQEQSLEVKPNFVTSFAFLRLAGALPKTEGFEFEMLDLFRMQAPVPSIIKFEKEEPYDHDGKSLTVRKYVLSDSVEEDRVYWVDLEGRVLKVRGRSEIELVLSDEQRAKE